MKVAVFSTKAYDESNLSAANNSEYELELSFFETKLNAATAGLTQGFDAICCFVNDSIDADVVEILANNRVKMIAMRCAGFNNVDIEACKEHEIVIARVPEYSPFAVAEHAVALILDLNRNIHRAFFRIRENDYSLDGLQGFDLHGKTVAAVGGGKIGIAFINIMKGFGCRVLCYDPNPGEALRASGAELVDLETVWAESDIISLHCPLIDKTHHIINSDTLSQMKPGVMIINTSRGGLIETRAVIQALKDGRIGHLGLDVYEEEANLFFEDNSNQVLQDDVFARLTTFNNVVITGHQAFFTSEALQAIAETTINNLRSFFGNELEKVCVVD